MIARLISGSNSRARKLRRRSGHAGTCCVVVGPSNTPPRISIVGNGKVQPRLGASALRGTSPPACATSLPSLIGNPHERGRRRAGKPAGRPALHKTSVSRCRGRSCRYLIRRILAEDELDAPDQKRDATHDGVAGRRAERDHDYPFCLPPVDAQTVNGLKVKKYITVTTVPATMRMLLTLASRMTEAWICLTSCCSTAVRTVIPRRCL